MDWAPDDSYLVFVDSPSAAHDLTFSGGTIKRAEHLGDGAFGPAEDIASVADLAPPTASQRSTTRSSPLELAKANITPSMGNSLPKWAPATAGDDVWWFAFASRRLYGSITSGNHQIWLSNQDSAHSNHIPLWVK